MAKYKVKHTTILHNKKLYSEGSTIELNEEQAKRLEDFVEFVAESTKTKTENKQPKNNNKDNKGEGSNG